MGMEGKVLLQVDTYIGVTIDSDDDVRLYYGDDYAYFSQSQLPALLRLVEHPDFINTLKGVRAYPSLVDIHTQLVALTQRVGVLEGRLGQPDESIPF